ncbi:MAG: 4-hydroxy-3-methylbut-2-enyl diphosphate reductase [Intrasporangium sp.]|uniref:4-hydroxy-3-methylbut-2-enyl diphosphate reductase n=1 Tax=Intrasporangium sp. TaxID=1925024 RepID=UPI002648894D|nr:4-hydroxy-3-methylbut-2-enyl diphosphate reductase [Intrasporangium sp.]MDN5798021.1 4-hydroxy-3-methylbut-2-enyl diphosphate reductase [Intrasporangium sp.]
MTAPLLVCVPSGREAAHLRRAPSAPPVARTGVGPLASARAAASPRVRHADALAVVGIGAGVAPELAPGDVVVASEVRPPHGAPLRCPSAPLLAGALRGQGLPVRVGPVASVAHVVTSRDRRSLAAAGVLAADMESAWLLRPAQAGAQAVIRVVADPAGEPLLRPGTLGHIRRALRTLPELAVALNSWGGAAGPHRVLLAGPRSFCAGVVRAIEVVDRALDQRGAPIYVRRQIVHNSHVVRRLEDRGAIFVEELDEVPSGATVIFSAHGVAPQVRAQAHRRGLEVIDATCPLVAKVHAEVRRFADDGDTVIFIGHHGHEEAVGTMGERPGSAVLVQDVEEAERVEVPDPARVSYLVQTTLAADEVGGIVEVLRRRFPKLQAPPSDDICYATTNRQLALREVSREAQLVLVVGSANSSNSQRLVETAQRLGVPAHLIDDVDGLDLGWLADVRTVGLTAGASAPQELVDEVVTAIGGLGPLEVTEARLVEENVHFNVPKEVRTS